MKVFSNMKRITKGFSGQEVLLFPTMLDAAESSPSPSRTTSSPSPTPTSSPTPEPSPTQPSPPHPSPTQIIRLVKERYSTTAPEGYDLMLWGDLHTLFEHDENDEIWRDQHEYKLLSWRLCDFCGIHILLMENGLAIHMLTEKKYPLSQEMLSKMLSKRLEVDHESSQAFELLRFIRAQVQK
ncbi:hypothetical protein Tco_0939869 [Tanacetum coccineum]|uniref:Uncharacterized protein n=1 Tax=Tanacetum coccineum TaxID=301880 RepID=A0ABQ5DSF1_9ASTR